MGKRRGFSIFSTGTRERPMTTSPLFHGNPQNTDSPPGSGGTLHKDKFPRRFPPFHSPYYDYLSFLFYI